MVVHVATAGFLYSLQDGFLHLKAIIVRDLVTPSESVLLYFSRTLKISVECVTPRIGSPGDDASGFEFIIK
jgi:hypothetical protein